MSVEAMLAAIAAQKLLERKLAGTLYEYVQSYDGARAAAKAVMDILLGDDLDANQNAVRVAKLATGEE